MPKEIDSPFIDPVDRLGEGLALDGKHLGGNGIDIIFIGEFDALLQDDGALVILSIGEMYRATAHRAATRLDRTVHMMTIEAIPAEAGNKRRMDIDHRPGKFLRRSIEFQIAGKADDIDIVVLQNGVDSGIVAAIKGR